MRTRYALSGIVVMAIGVGILLDADSNIAYFVGGLLLGIAASWR